MSVELAAPWVLVAELLPLWILVRARRLDRPPSVPVGTFALWTLESQAEDASATRRRPSATLLLLVAALSVAILGLAGPRRAVSPQALQLDVLVDASPSMFLAHTDPDGAATGRGTRLEVALESFRSWYEEEGRGGAALTINWTRLGEGSPVVQSHGGAGPPAAWLVAPRVPQREPSWGALDRSGSALVTDHAAGSRAGLFASGGGPVPGVVARGDGLEWVWDGASLVSGEAAPLEVRLSGELPAVLVEFVRVWAQERGHRVIPAGADEGASSPALLLESAWPVAPEAAVAERAGYRLRGEAASLDGLLDTGPGQGLAYEYARLAGGEHVTCAWGRGRVLCGWRELELEGDSAAFAVEWAERLDATLVAPAGVVPQAERAAAGSGKLREPRPRIGAGEPPARIPLTVWAAMLAGLLAVLALSIDRLRARRVSRSSRGRATRRAAVS